MSAEIIDFVAYRNSHKHLVWQAWPPAPMPWAETPQERQAMIDAIWNDWGAYETLREWWQIDRPLNQRG